MQPQLLRMVRLVWTRLAMQKSKNLPDFSVPGVFFVALLRFVHKNMRCGRCGQPGNRVAHQPILKVKQEK